jgi:two-component sensor histidine kinase
MARDGLMLPLHAAIKRAKKENKPTRKENVRIRENGNWRAGNTRSLAEARGVFTRRIQALAQSQSALLTTGFEGAAVAEIIRLECEAFSNQVNATGPDVMLNPKVAQTFALVLHELATNATKYGALSLADGSVSIRWWIEDAGADARFKFHWQETDGPPVTPSVRQGFGSIVLETVAASDFGAQPKISFAPEGLIYEIDAPMSVVTADNTGQDRF